MLIERPDIAERMGQALGHPVRVAFDPSNDHGFRPSLVIEMQLENGRFLRNAAVVDMGEAESKLTEWARVFVGKSDGN